MTAEHPPAGSPEHRRPRWGLRTMAFLGLAFVALVVSATLGHHTFGTAGSLVIGFAGAGYCSVRGLRQVLERGVGNILTGRRPPP